MKNRCAQCSRHWYNYVTVYVGYEQSDTSLGRLEYKQKRFVNVFACGMLPTCQVKVQIALKFSNWSIFFPENSRDFLKFFLMSKIPQKFRNYVLVWLLNFCVVIEGMQFPEKCLHQK